MVVIQVENDKLQIKLGGNDFSDQVESIKYCGAHWSQTKKIWEIHISKFDKVFKEMKEYGIDISEETRHDIKNYFDSIKELKKVIKRSEYKRFNEDLMLVKPL